MGQAKIYNPTPIYDAKLIRIQIDTYGTVFAIDNECDGFSIVDVNTPLMPDDVKTYLEGDDELLIYAVPTNISKLGQYALATFKNLETVYLFKNNDLMNLDLNAFGGLSNLENIYVPEALYDSYVSTYPTLSSLFKKLVSTYEWTIPEGTTNVLKVDEMAGFVGMLTVGQKSIIVRIYIPASYENYEVGATDDLFYGTFQSLEKVICQNSKLFLENAHTVNKTGYLLEVE